MAVKTKELSLIDKMISDSITEQRSLYEIVLIVAPYMSSSKIEEMIALLGEKLSGFGGKFEQGSEYWGLRNMSYEVKKERKRYRKAHYIALNFSVASKNVVLFENFIKLSCHSSVLRFMTFTKDSLPKERSPLFESSILNLCPQLEKVIPVDKDLSDTPPEEPSKPSKNNSSESNTFVELNYKNLKALSKFVSLGGRILPSYGTRLSCKNQRKASRAIRIARVLALMPYAVR
jgi:small subunit ribosomal protein S18